MRTPEQIIATYNDRKRRQDPRIGVMKTILEIYEGRYALPLPELDRNEKPAVANLMGQGIDQISMRIASTSPNNVWPSVRPGFKEHDERARRRQQVSNGWWETNKLNIKRRRRARHLSAMASTPVILRPWESEGIPKWSVRDPWVSFPAPTENPDDVDPSDCIFTFTRTLRWLRDNYGAQADRLYKGLEPKLDDEFICLEYVDADQITMIVTCKSRNDDYGRSLGGTNHEVLESVENRAGMCTAVVPGRITLDQPQGQFDQLVGIYWTQAMLTALEIHAVKRGVFQELWFEEFQGQNGGAILEYADGPAGVVGHVKGGQIKPVPVNPGFATNTTIDRLERAERLTGGIPAEMGGESTSNIRTGRRGDSVLSAAIDFPIQEAQEMMAASEQHENRVAVAIAKGYFKSRPVSMYVSDKNSSGAVTYTAGDLFDTDRSVVSYAIAGADINSLVISAGQRIGLKSLSRRSFMTLDPLVKDVEFEEDQITAEGLLDALMASVQQQAADPNGPYEPQDIARLVEIVQTNKAELPAAVQQLHAEVQKRQADLASQATPPGSPQAQPGLAAGPGQGVTSVAPPTPSQDDLAARLGQLRQARNMMRSA